MGYRVLLYPWIAGRLAAGPDSGVLTLVRWARTLNEIGEECYFYLALHEDAKYEPDLPNVAPVYGGLPVSWSNGLASVPERFQTLFDPAHGHLPVDVVITNSPGAAFLLPGLLWDYVSAPPAILVSLGAVTFEDDSAYVLPKHPGMLLAALGYATALCAYPTQGDAQRAFRHCRNVLSPALAKECECNAHVVPFGFDASQLLTRQTTKPERFRVLWSGRPNSSKRFVESMRVLGRLRSVRDDVQIVLNNTSNVKRAGHWYEMKPMLPKAGFYDLLCSCHVALSLSDYEAGPLSLAEALAAGLLLVVIRRSWSEEFLGTDYPLLANGPQEALTMLLSVMDDYEAWVARLEPWRRRAVSGSAEAASNMRAVFERAKAKVYDPFGLRSNRGRRTRLPGELGEAFADTIRTVPSEMIDLARLHGVLLPRVSARNGALRFGCTGYVHQLFRRWDTLDSPVPTYNLKEIRKWLSKSSNLL